MQIKVKVPATVANLKLGYDILGLALEDIYEYVTVSKRDDSKIVLSCNWEDIPLDPNHNSAGKGVIALLESKDLDTGFDIYIEKSIPLGSGLGGSAASAVGAVVGVNYLLGNPYEKEELLHFTAIGESASGAFHCDNVAPALLGGLCLVHNEHKVTRLPWPKELKLLSLHPGTRVDTAKARKIVPKEFPLNDIIEQTKNLSSFISSLYTNNLDQLKESFVDKLVESYRAKLIPNYIDFMQDLSKLDIIGAGISGSGPSIFILYTNDTVVEKVKEIVTNTYPEGVLRKSAINLEGAKVDEV